MGKAAARRYADDFAVKAASADAALVALAGDFVVRHRLDGRILFVEGDGWAPFCSFAASREQDLCEVFDEAERTRFLAHAALVASQARPRALVVHLRACDGGIRAFELRTAPTCDSGVVVSAFRENVALDDLKAELEATREEARL